jgi:exosortase D (VPLPA-CTERM-specific)
MAYLFSLLAPLTTLLVGFPDARGWLLDHWQSEEYSHSVLIPFVGTFLTLVNQSERGPIPVVSRYWGAALILLATLMLFLAHYGQMVSLYGYALLAMSYGVFVLVSGWNTFKKNWPAMLILIFMVPLPTVLFDGMSNYLQLVSSHIGAWLIDLVGISVHLEGNVIDLGSRKLQVVDACSGLRYLLPLMTLAFIVAVLHRAPAWRRIVLFLSSIPITIIMNSLRIALIAVLSEYAGIDATTGLMHDFEGWLMFMAAFGPLLLLVWVMSRLAGEKRGWSELLDIPPITLRDLYADTTRTFSSAEKTGLGLVAVGMISLALAPQFLPSRPHTEVKRESFSSFPMQLGNWNGRHLDMEAVYLGALPWNDYLWTEYTHPQGARTTLYIPFFDSLYKDSYTHNPRVCLPGNGWKIDKPTVKLIEDQRLAGQHKMEVNRIEATIADKRMLVYYWFQHKGQVITNQEIVKPILMWNSLTEGRTDGALVRLMLDLDTVSDLRTADALLEDMTIHLMPVLPRFVPD